MKKEKGFIGYIILVVIALILLKYFFNWSIFEATATPQGQETVSYTRHVIDVIWVYVNPIVMWVWNNIIGPIFHLLWGTLEKILTSPKK